MRIINNRKRVKWLIIIISIIVLALCGQFAFNWIAYHQPFNLMRYNFNQNKHFWDNEGISKYGYQLEIFSAPAGPWTGFVDVDQSNSIVSYEHDSESFVKFVSYWFDDANSVDKLFNIIDEVLQGQNDEENGTSNVMPDIFQVSYDSHFRYPSYIYIKYNASADDGFIWYRVSDFRTIQ